ncbi:PadR family transcriptional regulator [bacterium]|nr:PadR family transcriptional regulator [bacterium]
MTKVDLMVLGLLSEQPMYGYQLKRVLEEKHADLWSEVSTGHLYYTLKKLKKFKYVVEKTIRFGNRPPRHVYSLTDGGKKALKTGLDELDVHTQRLFFSLDIVIAFAKALSLPAGKLELIIQKRKKAVEGEIGEIKNAWRDKVITDSMSLSEYLIFEHRLSLLSAELKWVRWALKVVKGIDYRTLNATDFKIDGPYPLPK